MRFAVIFALFAISSTIAAAEPASQNKDEIKLINVAAAEVEKVVAAHKGKVVLLDVWGVYCLPCKKKFPHLIEMHKDLAKDGLVVLTLCVDEKEDLKEAVTFLKEVKAIFPNYVLDDTDANRDKLDKVLAHKYTPILHVFDRAGKKVKTYDREIKGDEMDVLVKELLKQK